MESTEVLIVGAGPIGLELAAALRRRGVDYLHLDAGQIGQTVSWYPRQVRFFSSPERIAIAGVPLFTADQNKATREEYLAYLRAVTQQFDLDVRTFERVTDIRPQRDGGFVVASRKGDTDRAYRAGHVVLAIGDMHRPRLLGIPGEDLPHVSHYFEEPHRYFRSRLVIVGGANSAVEAALRCYRVGAQVIISYRRDAFPDSIKYWLRPEVEHLIKVGRIDFRPMTQPVRITRSHVRLASLEAADETEDVEADFVLLLTGYEMDPTLFERAGVTLEGGNRAPKHDAATMETDVPGLFVAGTAAAGTQHDFRLFIENCHVHVDRIVAAITGETAEAGERGLDVEAMPES